MSTTIKLSIPTTAISDCDLDWLSIDAWHEFAISHPRHSIFHHRKWLQLMIDQYGIELTIPALRKNGEIVAAIPFFEVRSILGKKKLVSLPFADYVQLLGRNAKLIEQLCQQFQQYLLAEKRGMSEVVIHADEPVHSVESNCPVVRHELRTDRGISDLELGFERSIRKNWNKSERLGVRFQHRVSPDSMEMFYRLHTMTRRRLGVPVQPKSFFRRMDEALIKTGLGFIGIVLVGDRPIAAGVMLKENKRMVYKYQASDPTALNFRPNEFLTYHGIRIASEEGCEFFDFGTSEKYQKGLRRFKQKWGAVESDVHFNYLVGHPQSDDGAPSLPLKVAGAMIKRSPTFVCRGIGELLYKYSQ